VNGTVNDLALAGARLSAAFVIEEGLPIAEMRAIAASMGSAARAAGVSIAAGDTKVVEHGKADGLYISTAGVGLADRREDLGPHRIRAGDKVVASGTLGDHGMAILVVRGELELAVASDLSIAIDEAALPVRPEVSGACEILGLDPLYVASQGRLVAIVAAEKADDAVTALRSDRLGARAAIVGEVRTKPEGMVVLQTAFGGSRVVDMLAGDPLPRIC
jgi:hydrogenase expression/formation protein HypE